MNNIFIANFKTDISFEDYENQKFDALHNEIVKSGWTENMLSMLLEVAFYPIKNDESFLSYFSNSRELSYLIFQIFYCPQNLYIDGDNPYTFSTLDKIGEGGRFAVYDMATLDEKISSYEDYSHKNVFFLTYLVTLKRYFKDKDPFSHIMSENIHPDSTLVEYQKFFKDIQGVSDLGEEFNNFLLRAEVKNGKPYYLEAETKSKNTDFMYWKKKLGSHRKIEENANDDQVVSLKVIKKFKYE
ncbi:MAG TPA: hypothetical protein PKC14_02020 [Candidatus Absconditabacterales bacterium]|nr:hypothetical protein [Candidatus Absconditabacterales bacterium]